MLLTDLQPADVLLLDEQLCALNKPRGVPTRARPGLGGDCLYQAALRLLRVERLWLVHWLDRVTSGVVVLARSREAAARLSLQFEERTVRKTYLAWVEGRPPQVSGRIELPLTREGGRPRVDLEAGKPASTRYRVLMQVPGEPPATSAQDRNGVIHSLGGFVPEPPPRRPALDPAGALPPTPPGRPALDPAGALPPDPHQGRMPLDPLVLSVSVGAAPPRPGGLAGQTVVGGWTREEDSAVQTEGRTLLYLRPYTGRTHQLRVHLAALGCPIVGDPIHGHGRPEEDCLLHALELRLRHPQDGRALVLRAAPRDGFTLPWHLRFAPVLG